MSGEQHLFVATGAEAVDPDTCSERLANAKMSSCPADGKKREKRKNESADHVGKKQSQEKKLK